jgi:hypothetical protein
MQHLERNTLRLRGSVILGLVMLTAGCGSPTEPPQGLLQSSQASYVVQSQSWGQEVRIGIILANHVGLPIEITNCQGSYPWVLERWDGVGWRYVWSPTIQACLSLPIVVEPGATFADTLVVRTYEAKGRFHLSAGRYRLGQVPIQPSGTWKTVSAEARTSNAFDLIAS